MLRGNFKILNSVFDIHHSFWLLSEKRMTNNRIMNEEVILPIDGELKIAKKLEV